MPTLLSSSDIRLEWADIDARRVRLKPKLQRSPGTHLSGVIRYALQESGLLRKADEEDELPLRMALGLAWEEWAVGLWPKMKWQPGEVVLDRVYATPDGQTGKILEEFKATWKSSWQREVTAETIWMWQLAGMLKIIGGLEARLHVLWVNGNYRPPSPCYRTYNIGFSRDEIDRFWANVVMKNKDKARQE